MNTTNTMQSITVKAITIKEIELRTEKRRKLPLGRQYRITFAVGSTSRSTENAKESKNRTSWDNTFYFDGDHHSPLLVMVYQKHHIRSDKLVGTLNDTIGGALEKLRDGVLEDQLRNNAAHEPDLPGITIKFALVVEPRGNVDADDRQATHAVTAATDGVIPLSTTPAAVGLLSSAVNTGTSIATDVQAVETTHVWAVLMERIELLDKIVSGIAEIHPYTSLAWSVISAANKVLVKQKERDDNIIRLASTMSDVFAFVHDAEPLKAIEAHVKTIALLVKQVTECGYFVAEYAKQKNFWIRTARYTISDIDARITDYENKLRELKTGFLEGVAVQTEIIVVRMMNVVEAIAESIDLNDMPYASGARFEWEKECLPGTRESLIADICNILNDPSEDAPRVCLLTGVAGSGKSAVAHSIARLYDDQGRLGSSYCFSRSDVASRHPRNLFSTIARDLSDHDPQYKSALWGVVKGDRALRTSQSPMEQAEMLIIGPRKDIDAIGPLVIVIDAIDESGDRVSRRLLLRAIVQKIAENIRTTNLRFLITARPEDDILTALSLNPQIKLKQMGEIPPNVVDEDIEKFICHSLHQYPELECSWPNQEWCRLLVRHSQRLFQWASTACSFIEGEGAVGLDPKERLDTLLQGTDCDGGHSLDSLYRTILYQLFTLDQSRERFRTMMAIVLVLKEPLSLSSLSSLFGGDLNILAIIKPMGSLLDGVLDEEKPIRPLHTSFRDFLLDKTRSSIFHVHILPQHSLRLGRTLLASMQKMLRFNICDLKDSRVRNPAIPDLPSRVTKAIPPHLAYSCQYWMHHLQDTYTPDLLNEVTLFFKAFLPFWLEAISFLSLSSPLSPILSALETCTILAKWTKDQELATLASETSQFIQVFSPVLRESTPHLYLSAMSQTPSNSPLHCLWLYHLHKDVSVSPGNPASWPAEIHSLQGHTGPVDCVACSPDGIHIVSGSRDKTIRVWNASTGQCVAGPFQGHTDLVKSVAYSPDGIHIVSGSADNTIRVWIASTDDKTLRVWDASTGQCVVGPFHGHTNTVYCVAYSLDGIYITSGSHDNTIRVWNASTGQCAVGPFQGHTDAVLSVAYSPDGIHIVSGSEDKTIRVWNASTSQCVAGPFQGHEAAVWSVAYSHNGIHIVSGSEDMSIRVWDATTTQCVAGPLQGHTDDGTIRVWDATIDHSVAHPFQGHTDAVECVACSPDGTYIASGSRDKTIRVWNASSGQCVAGPFQGHTGSIYSIAYSPDGIHLVSGSRDNSIRIWNASTGQPVGGSLQEHTSSVRSVAYSPDGTHIASGSWDKTIMVWSASTGQCLVGPFQGHTDPIHCVAYSPFGTHIVSGSQDKSIRIWDSSLLPIHPTPHTLSLDQRI
ncbi:Quinonprotein alcohol dehydrogenase-like superfamily [Tylopilus felleus]